MLANVIVVSGSNCPIRVGVPSSGSIHVKCLETAGLWRGLPMALAVHRSIESIRWIDWTTNYCALVIILNFVFAKWHLGARKKPKRLKKVRLGPYNARRQKKTSSSITFQPWSQTGLMFCMMAFFHVRVGDVKRFLQRKLMMMIDNDFWEFLLILVLFKMVKIIFAGGGAHNWFGLLCLGMGLSPGWMPEAENSHGFVDGCVGFLVWKLSTPHNRAGKCHVYVTGICAESENAE